MHLYFGIFMTGFALGVLIGILLPIFAFLVKSMRRRKNRHGFKQAENAIIRRNEELLQSEPSDKAQEDFL